MTRRSQVRAGNAQLAEIEKWYESNVANAKKLSTSNEFMARLKDGFSKIDVPGIDRILSVCTVVILMKYCFEKVVDDHLRLVGIAAKSFDIFRLSYQRIEWILNENIHQVELTDVKWTWIKPKLIHDIEDTIKHMDQMIWLSHSKDPFVVEKQNKMIRKKASEEKPFHEEFIQWAMHPSHFESGWFADHGFMDEEGMLD